jgi:hypothetical protein
MIIHERRVGQLPDELTRVKSTEKELGSGGSEGEGEEVVTKLTG